LKLGFPKGGKVEYFKEKVYKYEAQRRLMRDLVSHFQLGHNGNTRVGLIGFANEEPFHPTTNLNGYRTLLDFSDDSAQVEAAIATTTSAGDTYLAGALELAKTMFDANARTVPWVC
jgi:hypothetical protein